MQKNKQEDPCWGASKGTELGRAETVGQRHHPVAHQGQVWGPLEAQAHGHLLPGHPHVKGQVQVLPANAQHQDPAHELAARHQDGLWYFMLKEIHKLKLKSLCLVPGTSKIFQLCQNFHLAYAQ